MTPIRENNTTPLSTDEAAPPSRFNRRTLLASGAAATAGLLGYRAIHRAIAFRGTAFLAAGQRYDGPLDHTIRDGLLATGFDPASIAGKRVLLKPNLVEPTRKSPQMTTHPAMVTAAAAVFRRWGAIVFVGEGPGHVRDTELALDESGMQDALDAERLDFADLNYEEVGWLANRGRASNLAGFWFPRSVIEADLIVSMPKMKTHHWVGFTASMKNLYGTIPGIKYGWPKNVLHHAGIPETVFDISATLPKSIAIVDGIVAMEGDGPIMGSPKPLGVVIIGTNTTAVDATVARLMGLEPERVPYLHLAANRLGPVEEQFVTQRGESIGGLISPFKIIDRPHLQSLRAQTGPRMS